MGQKNYIKKPFVTYSLSYQLCLWKYWNLLYTYLSTNIFSFKTQLVIKNQVSFAKTIKWNGIINIQERPWYLPCLLQG